MQRADPDFSKGFALLLAARRIETCEDDYARERLQPLAEAYRTRGLKLISPAMEDAPTLGGT